MGDIESEVLIRALGQLSGIGARWSAKLLPSVAHNEQAVFEESAASLVLRVMAILQSAGTEVPELPSNPGEGRFVVITGSGSMNLNPTLVFATVKASESGSTVALRAVAKEGFIKQWAARKAVERILSLLRTTAT